MSLSLHRARWQWHPRPPGPQPPVLGALGRPCLGGSGGAAPAVLTFLAVMLVVMEDEATATLALVAAERVDAVLLAAAVVLGALILVCGEQTRRGPGLCGG